MKKFFILAVMAMFFASSFAINFPGIRGTTTVVLNGEGKVSSITIICNGPDFVCLTSQDVQGMGLDLIYDGEQTFDGIDILNETHVDGIHTYNVHEY